MTYVATPDVATNGGSPGCGKPVKEGDLGGTIVDNQGKEGGDMYLLTWRIK